METKQFNARLHPDIITKIEQLQHVFGNRNMPARPISQADVMTLAINSLHENELGKSGKILKNNSKKA